MEFDYIYLLGYGTSATSEKIEITKQVDGVLLEYSFVNTHWDNKIKEQVEDKNVIRSIKKDLSFLKEIDDLLTDYQVQKWDGFNGVNSNVLDGGGFSFGVSLNNKRIITAHGSNSYPKGYRALKDELTNYLMIDIVKDKEFKKDDYSLVLPDRWLNNLNIRYGKDYAAFFTMFEEQERSLFIIYDVEYKFDSNKYLYLGKYDKEGTTYYISVRIDDSLKYNLEKLDAKQTDIINNLNDDIKEVIESLKLNNNYQLLKE